MGREAPIASATANVVYGWFYSAATGGSVAALFFLVTDSLTGHPFFTPSLMGSVAFLRVPADAVHDINLGAVGLMTLAHFAAFGVLGLLASTLFHMVRRQGGAATVVTGVALFIVMQAGLTLASATVLRGVLPRMGPGLVIGANALTAAAMAVFLSLANPLGAPEEEARAEEEEREEELVEGPGMLF
jgi:hypothetical protein